MLEFLIVAAALMAPAEWVLLTGQPTLAQAVYPTEKSLKAPRADPVEIGVTVIVEAAAKKEAAGPCCPTPKPAVKAKVPNRWPQDYAAAFKESKKTGKRMLLYFGTDWCTWCHRLTKQTMNDPAVQKAAEKNVICYIDRDKNKRLAEQFRVKNVPTLILCDAKTIHKRKVGFYTVAEMLKWLEY